MHTIRDCRPEDEAGRRAFETGIRRLEARTRDDDRVLECHEARGFIRRETCIQVYPDPKALGNSPALSVLHFEHLMVYGHYIGDDADMMRGLSRRAHDCPRFGLILKEGT